MQKLLILQSFHRYVPTGEFRTETKPGGGQTKPGGGQERVELERKEVLSRGSTVEVADDLAADWIAKGLAEAAQAASAGDAGTAVSAVN
jgi:hypothetical protein